MITLEEAIMNVAKLLEENAGMTDAAVAQALARKILLTVGGEYHVCPTCRGSGMVS